MGFALPFRKPIKMIKRPSKHETEEDLLRMQDEFLQQKSVPSVKLVKKPDKRKSQSEEPHSSGSKGWYRVLAATFWEIV